MPASSSTPTSAASRASNACEACRKRKIRCSGERPCQSCLKHHRECSVGDIGRKKYSETYVNRLLARLRTYEQKLNSQNLDKDENGSLETPHSSPPAGQSLRDAKDTPSFTMALDQQSGSAHTGTPSPADLASGPALDSHVRSLLFRKRSSGNIHNFQEARPVAQNNEPLEDFSEWDSASAMIYAAGNLGALPSEPEALRLLDIFLTYMGFSQHFFDPRAFTDSLTMLYRSVRTRAEQQASLWFSEFLLVLAIGRLLDNDSVADNPPGSVYFAAAVKRLPPLYELGEAGTPAVEVLALAATYLQWVDKKHDAYLYAGSGVRLAVALGYSQPHAEQKCLPSEATHRTRLFWTLYMIDRRLASLLSLPVGVNNPLIKADLPRDSAGFTSAAAQCVNIRIAQATGDIMCELYGNRNASLSRAGHVQKIEEMLRILKTIAASIPSECAIDLDAPNIKMNRTGASLYLMIYQAILLCLRPIILQAVRVNLSSTIESNRAEQGTGGFPRLVQACCEAASRSVRILSQLRQQNLLARLGSFDLDATFSAAFILVMIGLLSDPAERPLPNEIRTACKILQHMSEGGNRSAQRRLEDISQFCAQVWNCSQLTPTEVSGHINIDERQGSSGGLEDIAGQDHCQPQEHASGGWDCTTETFGDMEAAFGLNFDLTAAADDLCSGFNYQDLPLTGIDYVDWVEMEKLFNPAV